MHSMVALPSAMLVPLDARFGDLRCGGGGGRPWRAPGVALRASRVRRLGVFGRGAIGGNRSRSSFVVRAAAGAGHGFGEVEEDGGCRQLYVMGERETIRGILRQAKLSDANLALFHDEDLDVLVGNGFLTVEVFQLADPDVWKEILPERRALRGLLSKTFGASLAGMSNDHIY
jgi:hypothetical protein